MADTLFELVKFALDELYEDGQQEYGSKFDDRVMECFGLLTKSYGKLMDQDREPVDYHDPAVRFAYVYKYVAAHGDYLFQLLDEFKWSEPELFSDLMKRETLRVSCIGGGPGSDIVGVTKFLNEQDKTCLTKKMICYLLDAEQGWADAWTEVDDALSGKVQVSTNFQPLDVTNPDSWQAQKKFLKADLFTMSYFVSEVMSLDKNGVVTEFWETLFESAKPGSVFLYTDNGHDVFNTYIDKIAKSADLEMLLTKDNVKVTPSYDEQASHLGDYQKKFGGHYPKLKALLSRRVFLKPG